MLLGISSGTLEPTLLLHMLWTYQPTFLPIRVLLVHQCSAQMPPPSGRSP